MLHIYWGMGKGKTSAVNGSAIRAIGSGKWKPVIARFLKGRETSEDAVLIKAGIPVIRKQTSENFVTFMETTEEVEKSKQEAIDTMEEIIDLVMYKRYNFIVLDEIIDLVGGDVDFITEQQLVEFIQKLNPEVNEIMCTGHQRLKKLFNAADLISEITATKHYFADEVEAREGIEK